MCTHAELNLKEIKENVTYLQADISAIKEALFRISLDRGEQ